MKHPVDISEQAARKIENIIARKHVPTRYALRIMVRGSTRKCAGAQLGLGFDRCKEDDLRLRIKNIPVLIQKRELIYIAGKRLDFYDEGDVEGFHFSEI